MVDRDDDTSGMAVPGLVQVTFALPAPPQCDQRDEPFSEVDGEVAPTSKNAVNIETDLRSYFQSDLFPLSPVTSTLGLAAESRSWLGPLSRHAAFDIGNEFNTKDSPLFPCLLDWKERHPEEGSGMVGLRLQRVAEAAGSRSPGQPPAPSFLCNDYLIGDEDSRDDLNQLRWFLARLFAQRRNKIVAAKLAERIYHVWLPAAILAPTHANQSARQLALFPVVSLTRRPVSESWRHTEAITLVFVPVTVNDRHGADGEHDHATTAPTHYGEPRKATADEIASIVDLLRGSSFDAPSAADYEHVAGSLWSYLATAGKNLGIAGKMIQAVRSGSNSNSPRGSLRQWCELISVICAERKWKWTGRQLPDAVLRSLRMNSFWSVLVLVDNERLDFPQKTPLKKGRDGDWSVEQDVCEPTRLPDVVYQFLATLRGGSGSEDWIPLSSESRIDDLDSMEGSYLTWNVPGRRGILTVYNLKRESFPYESSLNLFGFLGHAVLAAAHSAATVDALNREPVDPKAVVKFAQKAHKLAEELDEMFDLDIVVAQYARMWMRMRRALGVDRQYRMARERLDLLTHYSEVIDRDNREERADLIGAIAAIIGGGILIFSIGLLVWSVWNSTGVIVTTVCLAALVALTVVLLYLYLARQKRRAASG